MKLLALTLALAIASTAAADDENPTPLEAAHSLTVTGKTMTGAGTLLAAVGGALLLSGVFRPYDSSAAPGLVLSGALVSIVGDVLVIAGAPMWGVGARREKRERAKIAILPTGIAGRF